MPKSAPQNWQRLSVSIIAAMLLMTLIMAVSMLVVSTTSVQRQIEAMPAEWRAQMERDRLLPAPAPLPPDPHHPLAPGPRLSRAERFRRDLSNNILWAVAISAGGAVLVGALLARYIARSVDEVSRAAQLVASGDLSARAKPLPGSAEMTRLTQHFNQMASGLERLEAERRDMIADIAHELRTPLAVVQARLDAFEDGVLSPTPAELALIGTQIELLTRLVSDLRTLSLADAGRLSLQLTPLDLSALAGRVSQTFASKASAAGCQLITDLTPDELPVEADGGRLSQVLINLLENAVRYAPPGSSILVKTARRGDWAILQVRDSGEGFAAQSIERVFARFYRAEESRSRESGGSGLGLSIVAALVQAHGGEVRAANAPQGGAEITVQLPLLRSEDVACC